MCNRMFGYNMREPVGYSLFPFTSRAQGRIKIHTDTPTEKNGNLNPPNCMGHRRSNWEAATHIYEPHKELLLEQVPEHIQVLHQPLAIPENKSPKVSYNMR